MSMSAARAPDSPDSPRQPQSPTRQPRQPRQPNAKAKASPDSPRVRPDSPRASVRTPRPSSGYGGAAQAVGTNGAKKVVAAVTPQKAPTARRAAPKLDMKAMKTYDVDDYQSVALLEQHRLDCVKSGKYLEAEATRARIQSLTNDQKDQQNEMLRLKHLEEQTSIHESQNNEIERFSQIWDAKSKEYEEHAVRLQTILEDRGVEEHVLYLDRIRVETEPRLPRWSPELLRMRKIQDTLGKQKKYLEANDIQVDADAMQAKEQAAFEVKRERKIVVCEDEHLRKQRLELQGLLKRIQSGRVEQAQSRKNELERIMQRYTNVKMQLDKAHKLTVQRIEKYPLNIAEAKSHFNAPISPMATPRTMLGA